MDGDQFIPPPPPPEEPGKRRTGTRKIAATALLSVGLLAGTGVGSFVIAHAASSTPASSSRKPDGEHRNAVNHGAGDQDAIDHDTVDQLSEHGLDEHDRLGVPSFFQAARRLGGSPHHHSNGLPSQSSSTG